MHSREKGHTPLLTSSDIAVNQAKTTTGSIPLLMACQDGHTPIVELLLVSSDIAVNQTMTMDGSTPLFQACQNRHASVVELLLPSRDIAVNQTMTDDGCTICCCWASPCLKWDRCQPSKGEQCPLFMACLNGHVEVVHHLLLQQPNIDLNKKTKLNNRTNTQKSFNSLSTPVLNKKNWEKNVNVDIIKKNTRLQKESFKSYSYIPFHCVKY